jgi:unsaturated chondroitin disaccharide hydrolase
LFQPVIDKGLEKLQGHFFGKAALVQFQFWSHHDHGAAGIIDSWSWAPYDTGWEAIIDNMMNLELLFWAAGNGGSSTFNTYALSHAEKTMANHFRADSSSFHAIAW